MNDHQPTRVIRGTTLRDAAPYPGPVTDDHTLMLMGVRAQAVVDARRHARIAPELFIPQVQP